MSEQLEKPLTGGCQCGRIRFAVTERLGRPSICHCRMCQKAFGSVMAPLVTVHGLVYTRGEPRRFASSNRVQRGFCPDCGTPLTYEMAGQAPEIAIGAFDDPAAIAPVKQFGLESRVPWFHALDGLPTRNEADAVQAQARYQGLTSFQHPDHET